MNYSFFSGTERSDLFDLQSVIEWPEFILHDPIGEKYWEVLYEKFPEYQFALMEGEEVVGTINSIPLNFDTKNPDFNEKGWDWALEKGFNDLAQGKMPTVLCGLQIGIGKVYRSKGISSLLIEKMRHIAAGHHFKRLILPIRPTLKHKYPLIPMEEYIRWQTPDGQPYDPWIRIHTRYGAELISVCHKAMYIPGTIREWETWCNLSIQSTGKYVFSGGLVPLSANVETGRAEYTEPNVWMIHKLI